MRLFCRCIPSEKFKINKCKVQILENYFRKKGGLI